MSQLAQMRGLRSLTIGEFVKTHEGKAQVESHEPFILGGVIYQGYFGTVIESRDRQVTDAELEEMVDLDNTRERVQKRRAESAKGRQMRRQQELDKREALEIAKKRDKLEYLKLQHDMAKFLNIDEGATAELAPPQLAMCPDCGAQANTQEDPFVWAREHKCPAPDPSEVECEHCHAKPKEGHHNPVGWLRGHLIHCKKKHEAK